MIIGLSTCSILDCRLVQPIHADEAMDGTGFYQMVEQANAAHRELLKSGTCSGRITIRIKEPRQEPTTIVDCDFRIVFGGEKFRLERDYRLNKLTQQHQDGAWGIEADGSVRQILISNGSKNYWVKFDATGKPTCMLLSRAWCDILLRNLDSPAKHPLRAWEDASRILIDDDLRFNVSRLSSGGIISRGRGGNWSVESYLLPPQPLCLSRVVVRSNGAIVKEHNLKWSQSAGVSYVTAYSVHSGGSRIRGREIWKDVKYSHFDLDAPVSPEVFEPKSLGLPVGTLFRANAPLPTTYEFDGEGLVRKK